MEDRRKISAPFVIIGALLVGYLGYLLAGCYEPGFLIYDIYDRATVVFASPFADYRSEYTVKAVLACETAYVMLLALWLTNQKTYMFGREYGDSKWIPASKISKELHDPKGYERIFTENLRISMNTDITDMNNNVFIYGGSGKGKSFKYYIPNILKGLSSFMALDPKGELLRKTAGFLKKIKNYRIWCLDLINPEKSDKFNPLSYVRKRADVGKLVKAMIDNTTPPEEASKDPFWQKAETLYSMALIYYVLYEEHGPRRNLKTFFELLDTAKASAENDGPLDILFERLEHTSPLGEKHPAVMCYKKCSQAAGDTLRSIIVCLHARFSAFEAPEIREIFTGDDIKLSELGTGADFDGKTKTALYCKVPDDDDTYNAVTGMLYTMLFRECYYQADNYYDGKLPIMVQVMADEAANVMLPSNMPNLMSTIRSRNISCVMAYQSREQVKKQFPKEFGTLEANCDVLLYLGGNDTDLHKLISEMLGQITLHKKATNQSYGRMGTAGYSDDVIGRALMTPAEVKKLSKRKAIVFVSGYDPVIDEKYNSVKHLIKKGGRLGMMTTKYTHDKASADKDMTFITSDSFNHYLKMRENREPVKICSLTMEDIINIPQTKDIYSLAVQYPYEAEELAALNAEKDNGKGKPQKKRTVQKLRADMSVMEILGSFDYPPGVMEEILEAINDGLPDEQIKTLLMPGLTQGQVRELRNIQNMRKEETDYDE